MERKKKSKPSRLTLEIGFGHTIMLNEIIGIFSVDTKPIQRMIKNAEMIDMLIDLTEDRKRKSMILLKTDYIVLTSITYETLLGRLADKGELLYGIKSPVEKQADDGLI